METISIAMATYNGSRFLEEQLESFLKQTTLPTELVVSDDASTDGTMDILNRFSQTSPFPVHIFANTARLGVNANFDRSISLCVGDIIFISDQDDVWFPTKIQRTIDVLRTSGKHAVYTNQIIANSDGSLTPMRSFELAEARNGASGIRYIGGGSACAFFRSYLHATLPVPADEPYDYWINGFAEELGLQAPIREPLQMWRRHENNASNYMHPERPPLPGPNRNVKNSWDKELTTYEEKRKRLKAIGDAIPSARQGIMKMDSSLASKAEALRERMDIIMTPRPRRLFKILRLLLTGGYREFNGLLSAAADLAR